MSVAQDFILTIPDNEIVNVDDDTTTDEEEDVKVRKKKKAKIPSEFNDKFTFLEKDKEFDRWGSDFALRYAKKRKEQSTVNEKIENVLKKKKIELQVEDEAMDIDSGDSSSDDFEDTIRVKSRKRAPKKAFNKIKAEEQPAMEDGEEKIQFSEEIAVNEADDSSFQDMNLSRPLLKALSGMNFYKATPIQAAVIPVALSGRDMCACSATGTGKTAAYMLPILERLLYKPKQARVTRVLVLAPTRELAVQIHQMSRQLAMYTNIEFSLSAGGLDIKAQEAALRLGPDIVIATPGRLIDHLHNAPRFNLSSIEILVLDEADRMLDEYFAQQMKEVIQQCATVRQTMLLSATMTEYVRDLAAVSLKNPVKVFVNENTRVAWNLRQEFIRIRPNREGDREAIAAALVKRIFTSRCLMFVQTKQQVHRLHIMLGLLGVKALELHGNLSQAQRLEALEAFREGKVDVLIATDLAARGLDIENVQTVINFTMPGTLQHYIHRVGRTARAGRTGRSISLAGEKERKLLKDIIKNSNIPVKCRVVAPEVVQKYKDCINNLEQDIADILQQEDEEKQIRAMEFQVEKVEKKLKVTNESDERKRDWFQTPRERKKDEAAQRLTSRSRIKKLENHELRKMLQSKKAQTAEDRVELQLEKAAVLGARQSKKLNRPQRSRACATPTEHSKKKKKKSNSAGNKKSSFDKELTSTSGAALKMLRSGPAMSYQERKEKGLIKKRRKQPK